MSNNNEDEVSNPRPTSQQASPTHSEELKLDLAAADQPMRNIPDFFHLSLGKTPLALLTIFSFLKGNILYHRIALLNRKVRSLLIQSFFLDQEIMVTQRVPEELH